MNGRSSGARLFLFPWIVGFAALTALPVVVSLALSFTQFGDPLSMDRLRWVGLSHYRQAVGTVGPYNPDRGDPWHWNLLGGKPDDVHFHQSLYNSITFSLFAVPLGLAASLMTALLLNLRLRGTSVARTLIYIPHVLGGAATIVIWSWLFNPEFGWVNEGLRCLYRLADPVVRLFREQGTADFPTPAWLYSPVWCKPAVVIMHVWGIGGSMLIFLAALHRVPRALYDAARLDGSSAWRQFLHVTWPHITPVVLFNLVVSLVFTMQSFTQSYFLETRQQKDGLLFFALYVYRVAFEPPYRFGYASALAWIFVLVLIVLIVPILLSGRLWVYYAGSERTSKG